MSRLPIPGSDDGTWGNILNDFLSVEHKSDGTLKARTDGTIYTKPAGGIPVSDLSSSVQTSLSQANNAVQIGGDTMTGALIVPGGTVTGLGWFNVKANGAIGNGSANDTTAIQNTINAAAAAGGTVYIPTGNYLISSALSVPANITIRGEGQDRSIIIQQSTTANGMTMIDANYVTLQDFRLQGPASGTGIGISLQRSSSAALLWQNFRGLYIRQFGSHGISASNTAVSLLDNVTCESNGGHGFNFFGVAMAEAGTSVHFNSCYANNNAQAGFYLFKMVYCVLTSCAADSAGIGYLIDTCESCSLVGCGTEFMINKSVSYPGIGFKVTTSLGIGLYNTWTNHNISSSWWITGSSTGVTMLGAHENEPTATATALIKVDSGCSVTLADYGSTDGAFAPIPNNLAAGTTTILNDGAQGVNIPGTATLAGGFSVGATAQPRFRATTNGGLDWGDGTNPVDTNLYRGGNGVLVTDGAVVIGSKLQHNGSTAGFYGTNAVVKPTVTGAKGGNAALTSLLSALASMGLITDSTS